jgi:hypothetical protein
VGTEVPLTGGPEGPPTGTPDTEMVYDMKYYDINSIQVVGRNVELKLNCTKRSNENVIRR